LADKKQIKIITATEPKVVRRFERMDMTTINRELSPAELQMRVESYMKRKMIPREVPFEYHIEGGRYSGDDRIEWKWWEVIIDG